MRRTIPLTALLATTALALAGCAAPTPPAADDTLSIVASTIVYGSIAERVAGLRGETLEQVALASTANAQRLFRLPVDDV